MKRFTVETFTLTGVKFSGREYRAYTGTDATDEQIAAALADDHDGQLARAILNAPELGIHVTTSETTSETRDIEEPTT